MGWVVVVWEMGNGKWEKGRKLEWFDWVIARRARRVWVWWTGGLSFLVRFWQRCRFFELTEIEIQFLNERAGELGLGLLGIRGIRGIRGGIGEG